MRVLVVLTLVAVAYGAAPKPCCISNKYSSNMIQFGGSKALHGDVVISDNTFTLDYDYDAKKTLMVGESQDMDTGAIHNLTILQDFNLGKVYSEYDGNCAISQVPVGSMTPPCIPDSFVWEGDFTFGVGAHSITVHSWTGNIDAIKMRLTMTEDCVPVTMYQVGGERGDNSTQVLYSYAFANVKKGQLTKTDPFQVPQSCKTASQPVG